MWDTIAALATAVGVLIAAWQIRESRKLSQSSFEDTLDQQYRDLAHGIPVDALIGRPVNASQETETRELIYNYLDLCNEQVFLRKKNRITQETWKDWCAGIESHLQKVAFKQVWEEIKAQSPGSFSFLEKLENEGFSIDPREWER
jgi:hypothetical protein